MQTLGKNLLYNVSYQVLVIFLPLITAPYISRVLGAEGIGTYSFIYSVAYYFGLCGMLGVANHGNRSVALARGNKELLGKTFWNIYSIQFATTFLALMLYLGYMFLFCSYSLAMKLSSVLFVLSYVMDINWFFFGMEQFKITVIRNACIKLLTVICIFAFVKEASDLWLYIFIMSLGMVLGQAYLWAKIGKFVSFVKPEFSEIKRNIKPMLILFIPVIAYSIYKVMDKIMLGALASMTEVGYYENADRIVNIPVSIITAFGTVMMPRIASLIASDNKGAVLSYAQKSFKYFSLIAIGMTCGLAGVSDVLAPVYFGEEFAASAPIIRGLSVTLLFMTWANIIRTQYLIPNKQDRPYVVSAMIGAVLNLVCNLSLIPVWGAKGALVGTIIAEFSVFLAQAICVRKEFPVVQYLKPCLLFGGCGLVMTLAVERIGAVMGKTVLTLVVQVGAGFVLYLVLAVLAMVLTHDGDLKMVLRKIRR